MSLTLTYIVIALTILSVVDMLYLHWTWAQRL